MESNRIRHKTDDTIENKGCIPVSSGSYRDSALKALELAKKQLAQYTTKIVPLENRKGYRIIKVKKKKNGN